MHACLRDPLVVSSENEREIFHGRDSFRFLKRIALHAPTEQSRKEGGKTRAINRRARNARNAAGHRATRDHDHSCQMPSNHFVSCHPVRLLCSHGLHSLFPALDSVENARYFLLSCSRFVLDYKRNVGLHANASVIFALFEFTDKCRSLRSRSARGREGDAHARHRLIQVSIVGRVRATRYRFSL